MNQKTPTVLLKEFAADFAGSKLDAAQVLFDNPDHKAIPKESTLIAGIAAAARGSATCADIYTERALEAGATEAGVSEIVQVTRYMRMAADDSVGSAFEILSTDANRQELSRRSRP